MTNITLELPPITPKAIGRILCALMNEPEFAPTINTQRLGDLGALHWIDLPRDHGVHFDVLHYGNPQLRPRSNPYWAAVSVEVITLLGGSLWFLDNGGPANINLPHRNPEDIACLDLLVKHLKPIKPANTLKWARYVAYPKERGT